MINVNYNNYSDVLYIKINGSKISNSKEAPNDLELILNMDSNNVIIGVQFIGISKISYNEWLKHLDRSLIPLNLLSKIDDWIINNN